MRSNKKLIALSLALILVLGAFVVHNKTSCSSGLYRLEVIGSQDGVGYGYQIYRKERVIILQPFVPAIPGKKGFLTKQEALRVGDLVMERLSEGQELTVSRADLRHLGITY